MFRFLSGSLHPTIIPRRLIPVLVAPSFSLLGDISRLAGYSQLPCSSKLTLLACGLRVKLGPLNFPPVTQQAQPQPVVGAREAQGPSPRPWLAPPPGFTRARASEHVRRLPCACAASPARSLRPCVAAGTLHPFEGGFVVG